MLQLRGLIMCLALFLLVPASALAGLVVTVSAQAGPWSYLDGGLNTAYQYGVGDQLAPKVVSAADGLSFLTGNLLTVTYISALVNVYGIPCPGQWCTDADGYGAQNEFPGSSGLVEPSFYIPSSEYDVGLGALVGVFADAGGAVVGTPHKLGNGPTTLVIPAGATQFQMGLNDDIYRDNGESLTMDVSVASVPEPSTWLMLASAFGVALIWRGRKKS